jgi:hypothetical protein
MESDVLRGTIAADVLAHETFTNHVPLKRGSIQIGAIPIQLCVRSPRHGAMIDNDVVNSGLGRSIKQDVIAGVVLHIAAHANPQVAKNNVVGAVDAPNAPVAIGLPGTFDLHAARRSLPGHGEIGRAHPNRAF